MLQIPLALTYSDVLIVPKRSSLSSRTEANVKTRLTNKINLNIPIISSNMDTVTESEMAIALARLGGIGFIHRFMTIEDNIQEIKRVKRAQNFIINDPYSVSPDIKVGEAKLFAREKQVTGLIVADENKKLVGLVTHRDLVFADDNSLVRDVMTPRARLVVGRGSASLEEAKLTIAKNKVEKIPLVDENDIVIGLITSADIYKKGEFPEANVDVKGQLIVGGSIGVKGDYLERAQELIKAGADVLAIDIAHGFDF